VATPVSIPESVTLAFHAMALIAIDGSGGRLSLSQLRIGNASLDHLSKVLQKLVRAGFLRSKRGAKGGFLLVKPPEEITLLDIWVALEGKVSVESCSLLEDGCPLPRCVFGTLVEDGNRQFKEYFAHTTLASFAAEGN